MSSVTRSDDTTDMHRYNNNKTADNVHLKPMPQGQAPAYFCSSITNEDPYQPIAPDPSQVSKHDHLQAVDRRLKYRIRVLRLISRSIAFILSLTTLVPLALALAKFLSTKDTYFTVDGKERTAWAHDSITWYTYMYFGVSLVSFVFNLAIMTAYWRGIKKANIVASVATWWTSTVLVGHVLIWAVSAALYRYGKAPVGGKFRDLWGW
jgi:hypothetical protein